MTPVPFSELLTGLLVFPLFLLFTRVGAAVMVFPAISDPSVNIRVRLLITLGISFLLLPLLADKFPVMPTRTADVLLLLFGEMVIGLMLGLGARLMMAAMSLAGEIIAFLAGFQGASLFDPSTNTNSGAPSVFLTLCAGVVVLGLNMHHQLIQAAVESYSLFKPGVMPEVGDIATVYVEMMTVIMRLGLQLAAPVVVAGLLTNAMFGVLNRLVPQLQIFFISVPVTITVSVVLLVAGLGSMLQLWATATQDRLTLFQVEEGAD
ncbi:MAG: flagellar biosynthetic protein FliR [Blastochloris viridis]|uniref:Flagellar biosynthetic protein FliR n=1 Tax=Blastochloris viridis TaxID=1079 RepID=A0A6N4RDV8_BLAVI|nr:MAG: flagellar biosynthetic protein FliR [Blastochloris viridis]